MITEESCLKCHSEQGYKVGDLRGGISVSVPMAPIQAVATGHALTLAVGHFVLWLLGAGGISLGWQRLKRHVQERNYAEGQIESLAKFPSENPNPVLRIAKDGVLLYANSASESLLTEWGCKTGQLVPDNWQKVVMEAFGSGGEKRIDTGYLNRTYSFVIAPVTEAGYANLYGRDISERRKVEKERKNLLHELKERVKELTCMYRVAKSIRQRDTLKSIFQDVTKFIPPGWHYPEITCARVCFDGSEYVSDFFKETQWKQASDLVVDGEQRGSVEVYYLEEKSTLDEGPFLKEERNLIDGIAGALNEVIEKIYTEEKIHNLARFPSENPNPVLRIGKDGNLLYANAASQSLLDKWACDASEAVPEKWRKMVVDAFAAKSEKRVEVIHNDQIFSFMVIPVIEADYANLYGRDITERKKVEKALQKAHDELEIRVMERTEQLQNTVGTLQSEVTERIKAEEQIRSDQRQLRHLATELLLTEERERRAIATELHDSIGQILAFSSIELGNMTKSSSTQATKGLKRVRKHIEQAITAMRTLTFNLSPPVLYTFGLEAAVEDLAEQSSKEHNFRCDFICGVNSMPMSNEVQVLLYRAVRELLANIAKHAMANTVKIALNRVDNMVKITIEDDGVGFDQGKAGDVSDELKGFGLFSIRERLSHFGGSFEIQSGLGRGTKVMLTAPLENEDENKNGD
jgi:signal transduction histidine kinase